jgi:putative phosphoesterase
LRQVRLAIISDTHMPRGPRRLPDICLERLEVADAILHCGDVIGADVLDELDSIGPPLHAVQGNVDDATVRARLPARLEVDFAGVRIGMVHDPGPRRHRLERLRRWFPAASAVCFGPTHLPEHEELDGFQIFNPGSPTERRRAPAHTMGEATITGGRLTFDLFVLS